MREGKLRTSSFSIEENVRNRNFDNGKKFKQMHNQLGKVMHKHYLKKETV